jgi:ferritin-like metal-binding protein YciE
MAGPEPPPQVDSAEALLRKQLGKLLTIEETLARTVLPKLQQEAKDEQLQQAFAEHLDQTRGHADNVRTAFAKLGASASGGDDKVLDAAKEEREHEVQQLAPALRDGFNASTAMGTEHHEIAEYEAAIRLAEALGHDDVSKLLRANLSQEVDALEKLGGHATRLAEQGAKEPAVRSPSCFCRSACCFCVFVCSSSAFCGGFDAGAEGRTAPGSAVGST